MDPGKSERIAKIATFPTWGPIGKSKINRGRVREGYFVKEKKVKGNPWGVKRGKLGVKIFFPRWRVNLAPIHDSASKSHFRPRQKKGKFF